MTKAHTKLVRRKSTGKLAKIGIEPDPAIGESSPMENRIKEIRQRTLGPRGKPLTQDELAQMLDTSAAQIGRLENSKRGLRLEWIQRIAKALGVDAAEL